MAEYTLRKREDDWLKLNIGENSYRIPLATTMKLKEAQSMETMDGAISFFIFYIDDDVAENLSLWDYKDILTAWKDASEKAANQGDPTPGES